MPIEIRLKEEVNYTGKEPGSIGEAIVKQVFNNDNVEASLGIRVREDVVVREKTILLAMKRYITRKREGCGEKTNSGRIIAREKWLEVVNAQIWDQICAEDFGDTIAALARKKGYDVNNLEDTEIEDLLKTMYIQIWENDFQMMIQFGDTTIDKTPPAGDKSTWTEAQKDDYSKRLTLSIIDGFWTLALKGVGLEDDDPDKIKRAVVVPGGALPANYTRDIFLPGLYEAQPRGMAKTPNSEKLYVLSTSLYNNLAASLRNYTTTGEKALNYFVDGTGTISFEGITISRNDDIEEEVETFKRRGYLTVKGGFEVGTDTHQVSQVMAAWFDRNTDLNNIQIRYKIGMQYADGDVTVVGY
ncbi:hypothetical protein [Hymenobacter fodinae]|uniref:Uncharacterized protein n=1 Tax=Hymenobacter fodinae TaxID=2510796 RepID=A0A4Z0P8Q0_9BACT|nr:hypothetical protein [Hymenobacter fodinae]TGE08752.1 hypothetical protein EU556_13785 [Hymenobacter fodinae]